MVASRPLTEEERRRLLAQSLTAAPQPIAPRGTREHFLDMFDGPFVGTVFFCCASLMSDWNCMHNMSRNVGVKNQNSSRRKYQEEKTNHEINHGT